MGAIPLRDRRAAQTDNRVPACKPGDSGVSVHLGCGSDTCEITGRYGAAERGNVRLAPEMFFVKVNKYMP